MAPAQGKENVAVFNPIVLALPNWHPDGPDGDVDGYVVPFVMPDDALTEGRPNRDAKIAIHQHTGDWRAVLRNCQDHAGTADQARALAAAWIRAAEVLEAIEGRAEKTADVEVQGDEHNGAPLAGKRAGCPACTHGTWTLHGGEE